MAANIDKECPINVTVSLKNNNGKLTVGNATLNDPNEITKCMKTGTGEADNKAPEVTIKDERVQENRRLETVPDTNGGKRRRKSRRRGKRGGRKSKRRTGKKARKSKKGKRRSGKKSKRRRRRK